MKKSIKKLLIAIVSIIVLLGVAFAGYIGNYYRADDVKLEEIQTQNPSISVEEKDGFIVFEPKDTMAGLIFYPGAKVEYIAYAPLMEKLANEGILCILIQMPGNLAILDKAAAEGMQELYPEVQEWYIAGHSMGGAMAAMYLGENETAMSSYAGIVMLAAYSTKDLSNSDLKVLQIYGTEDKVIAEDRLTKNEKNLPKTAIINEIEGGCHSYFGNYGIQSKDGVPTITLEKQQEITVQAIRNLIEN